MPVSVVEGGSRSENADIYRRYLIIFFWLGLQESGKKQCVVLCCVVLCCVVLCCVVLCVQFFSLKKLFYFFPSIFVVFSHLSCTTRISSQVCVFYSA